MQQHMDTPIAIAYPGASQLLGPHLETGLIGAVGLLTNGRPA